MIELEAQGRQVLGGWPRNSASVPHWFKLAIATILLFVIGGILAPTSVHADAFLSMLPFMAILALASDMSDLEARLGRIIVGATAGAERKPRYLRSKRHGWRTMPPVIV